MMLHIPTKKSKHNCHIRINQKRRGVLGFEPEKFTHCLTLCVLMDSSIRFDTINLGQSIIQTRGFLI